MNQVKKNSIFAALVILFVTHSAHALDPSQPVSSYIRTQFTDKNELPSNIVDGIVQTRDGFLWLAFGAGFLTRFDGQGFTMLPLSKSGPMALAVGPNGDLWVGTLHTLRQIPTTALNQYGPLQAISFESGLPP